jgi:hypothetical protein
MIMNKQTVETFSFSNLGQLREWLNRFERTNLDNVLLDDTDWLHLDWIEETLSDGSIVNNARFRSAD